MRQDEPVRLKRVYDPAEPADGFRALVTTYWPRGVRRETVDAWVKELGTPPEMLKAYQDGRVEYGEFCRRYRHWLQGSAEALAAVDRLAKIALERPVTLLTSFRDLERSHVPVLRQAVAVRAVELLAQRALERSPRFQAILVHTPHGGSVLVGQAAVREGLEQVAQGVEASGRDLELEDAEEEGRSLACYAGSYSLLAVPAQIQSRPQGAVVAESEQIGAFSAEDRSRIRSLAQQVAPFLSLFRIGP